MIITRTPLRISFVGGGTDFEDYYRSHGGQVISTTIDKFVYVTVNHKFDEKIHLRYAKTECVDNVDDLQHNIARESLKMVGIKKGIEITIISDIPSQGSGLGSSSSLSVGLLKALYAFTDVALLKSQSARKACSLEIDILKSPIGRQDQYAASYGGLNKIVFHENDQITVNKITDKTVLKKRLQWLKDSTMLFYLSTRSSNNILDGHKNTIDEKIHILDNQKKLVIPFMNWLYGKTDNQFLGNLITKCWEYKKIMTPLATSDYIDDLINTAIKSGAVGAKLCGAGGGGFLMVICDKQHQNNVRNSLNNLLELEFCFENEGAKIIYED